jgi:pantetheine-phosphate adenylyltransferase
MGKRLSKVAVGGTFDKLHRGHKKLLLKAFKIGDTVVIGLTTDEMQQSSQNHIIEPIRVTQTGIGCVSFI